MKIAALLTAFILTLTAHAEEVIKPDEASKHVGKEATVSGKVSSVKETNSRTIYINLGAKPYPEQDFTIFVRAENAAAVKDLLPKLSTGDTVSVTGKISLHRGKPQIEVTKGDQVKRLEQAAPKP